MSAKTSATPESVFQLKITLRDFRPPVWRRVLVPTDYTFKELHSVIMAVMKWDDTHLHVFRSKHLGREIEIGGVGDQGFGDFLWLPESTKIAEYFDHLKQKIRYEYDFGCSWEHDIVLEKMVPVVLGQKYPQCVAGKQMPPPEDDPDSKRSEEFDLKKIDFSQCRLMEIPPKGKENDSSASAEKSHEVKVLQESNGPPAKKRLVDTSSLTSSEAPISDANKDGEKES